MGIKEKITNAKKTSWMAEGFTASEVKSTIQLAQISAKIERRRLELGMTQKEFADFMGVTQGMVSKWESREYNFTVKSLNEICQKINLNLSLSMECTYAKNDYSAIKWDKDGITTKLKKASWIESLNLKEEIA